MAQHHSLLQTALIKFTYPDIAMDDIVKVISRFSDLRPSMDIVDCKNGRSENMLCLRGTIPVSYLGSVYDIPVTLWLGDAYPHCSPEVFVTPSAQMQIKPGRHVDYTGKVHLRYLREWTLSQSHLLGLVEVMRMKFGTMPPVFSKTTMSTSTSGQSALSSQVQKQMTEQKSFLENALTKYTNPDSAMNDITRAMNRFSDLRPSMDLYYSNDGRSQNLLCLKGTIPVPYLGCRYNIPVALWLGDSYPMCPPDVFVTPTADMLIKPGRHVDSDGKVHLPYLSQWRYRVSHMLGLVEEMCIKFEKEPPVYSATAKTTSTSNPAAASSQSELTKTSHESDIEELRNKLMCKICMDQDACVLFDDCSHMACCENCARSVSKCPICRSTISNRRRVFTA